MNLKDTIEVVQYDNDPLIEVPSNNVFAQTNLKIALNQDPEFIIDLIYLPVFYLKSLCAAGHINKFLKIFINDFRQLEDLKFFEYQINSNPRLFGTSVEQISQTLCLAYPIRLTPSTQIERDNWTAQEECLLKIECSPENYFKLYITLESEDPQVLDSVNKKLLKEIKRFNSIYFGKELKNYHITPIKNGFCMPYNILLAFTILKFSDQINEHFEEPQGFILKI